MTIIDQSEVILNLLFSVNNTVIHHICADLSVLKIKKKETVACSISAIFKVPEQIGPSLHT